VARFGGASDIPAFVIFGAMVEGVALLASGALGLCVQAGADGYVESRIASHPDIKPCRLARLRTKVEAIEQQIASDASSEIEQVQMRTVRRLFINTIRNHS
jgi:hypothetical protein